MREPDGVIGFVPHLRRPERKEVLRFRLMIKRGLNETATKHQKGEAQHEVLCGSRRLCQRNERVHCR